MFKVGVIGATGYAGVELVRLLLRHPKVKRLFVSSVSFEGQKIEDTYPNLRSCFSADLLTAEDVVKKSNVIFTSLPHGIAEKYAQMCLEKGKKLIDLSADFRFDQDEALFEKWYKKTWDFPETHKNSVYGLPELNREQIRFANIVGNPGCYVTSATLALLPAIKNGLIKQDGIIIDSKSGVTGAGRTPTMTNQFSECGESFSAYGIGSHRHQGEIEFNLTKAAGSPCSVIFTPHLIPMSRGILSTIYAPLDDYVVQAADAEANAKIIHALFCKYYEDEPFVRILPLGSSPATKNVRYSNYCDISVHVVNNGKTLQLVSVLDNMVKGAAGQAIQNMNIMYGFAETAGINMIPPAF